MSAPTAPITRLDIHDAATYVGVSEATIRRRIHDGRLPAFKVANRYEIETGDLDEVFSPKPVTPLHDSAALITDLERAAQLVAAKAPPLSASTRQRLRDVLSEVI